MYDNNKSLSLSLSCITHVQFLYLDGCVGINGHVGGASFPSLQSLHAKGLRLVKSSAWCDYLRLLNDGCPSQMHDLQLGECSIGLDLVCQLLQVSPVPSNKNNNINNNNDDDYGGGGGDGSICENNFVTKDDVIVSCNTCHLTHLDLSWCELPGCHALALACASGRHLQSLTLRCVALDQVSGVLLERRGSAAAEEEDDDNFSFNSNTNFKARFRELPNVESYDNMVLSTLGRCCPNLTELNLGRCGETLCGEEALHDLTRLLNSKLLKLDLNWTNVTDEGLLEVISNCNNLKVLGLQGCKKLTVTSGY
jgi:hypothetical protein